LLITITSFGSLDDLFEIWTQNLLRIIKFSNFQKAIIFLDRSNGNLVSYNYVYFCLFVLWVFKLFTLYFLTVNQFKVHIDDWFLQVSREIRLISVIRRRKLSRSQCFVS